MATNAMEQLKNLVDEERYDEAAALLPGIKEHSAKTVSEMMAMAKMLGKTGEWARAEKLYLKAYKKRPSRLVLRDVMMMFIDCSMANEAENYYNQYIDLTPGDIETKLGAKYRIEKIRGTEANYLIGLLQQLKEETYTEEYAYELCKQYYKANDEEACRAECAELIEAFPDTKEAEKAKKLIAVMNGELSADEIKSKSGMASPAPTAKEINTKDLPNIEYTQEEKEREESQRAIAESVQDIISEEATEEVTPEVEAVQQPGVAQELETVQESEAMPEPEATQEAEAVPEPVLEPVQEKAQHHQPEEVAVRIYAEKYTPKLVLGKEDFAETKARSLITTNKIEVEAIFGQYFRNANIRRQIYNCIELALIEKGNPWIMVSGEEKTGRTYFGKKLIFTMFSMGILTTKRVAVTKAAVINRCKSEEIVEKTGGANIIVEKATELTAQGLEALKKIKVKKKEKICIIFEDTEGNFATFIKNSLSSGYALNNRIHFPKYNTEDLLGFAYDYINKQDYGLEKVAADLIVSCINSTRAMTQGERFMHALQVASQSVETADKRVAPEILKMAAEAAFQEYYSLTIIREDITP